jgi:predicted  nucleic acid-binding Zn-ribbon protein
LLEVQQEDLAIHEVEQGIAALMPRVSSLSEQCTRVTAQLAQAQQALEAEKRRRGELDERIRSHKQLHDKHQAVLNSVTSQRESAAAMAQLEQVARIIAEEERELSVIGTRIKDASAALEERERALEEANLALQEAEASIATDRERLQSQLGDIRQRREQRAQAVPRTLLHKYDRIRSRRHIHAIYPLRGTSCGHCDTAVPLQRRSVMLGTGATELCEGCGVLLYAMD